MTLAILGILGALIPFVLWLARRRIESETPEKQHLDELKKADTILAERNEDKINTTIDDTLRDIESRGVRNTPGKDNPG